MKRKYYLRGLGIGILVTVMVFIIISPSEMTDDEIIKRAEQLGYVKAEAGADSNINLKDLMETGTPAPTEGVVSTPVPEVTSVPVTMTPEPTPIPTLPLASLEETPAPTPTATPMISSTVAPTATIIPEPTTMPAEAPVFTAEIIVERGDSANMVCNKIEMAGIVDDGNALKEYLIGQNLADYINIGIYTLTSDMTFEEIANILTK